MNQSKLVQTEGRATDNSGFKKLAVQWLQEVQFFNQTFVQVESFVLRNRKLLIAANRNGQALKTRPKTFKINEILSIKIMINRRTFSYS